MCRTTANPSRERLDNTKENGMKKMRWMERKTILSILTVYTKSMKGRKENVSQSGKITGQMHISSMDTFSCLTFSKFIDLGCLCPFILEGGEGYIVSFPKVIIDIWGNIFLFILPPRTLKLNSQN